MDINEMHNTANHKINELHVYGIFNDFQEVCQKYIPLNSCYFGLQHL